MLSIIIPTYNERDNIELLITRLESALKTRHEIIVVDDNSPDGTALVVTEIAKKYLGVHLISRNGKGGLTSAIVAGVDAAKGEDILVMDADLSHPPEKVPELYAGLAEYDLVVGSRLISGGKVENWPFHRRIISEGAESLARIILEIKCTDPLSGFFAIKKEIFHKTTFRTNGYKLLLNILADNPKIRLKEVPYTFKDRHAGKTKLGAGEVLSYVCDLIRIEFGRRCR